MTDQRDPLHRQSSNLWCCHACKMIGSEAEGKAHRIARGHDVEELSADVSEAVRAEWFKPAADLIAAHRSGMLPLRQPWGSDA